MTPSEIKIAVVSDIHLGHRRNKTEEILKNLSLAFPDNAETAELDVLFLAGDVFDDVLMFSDIDCLAIEVWIAELLRICKKHNVAVRVLEGTPSHDWKQSEHFQTVNEVAAIGADLKYVKTLSIEYIESIGKTVLYVPDEWETTTDKTLSQVRDLLRAKGLESVDIAIMHGQFDYQVPEHLRARIPCHDSKAYMELVRDVVAIGHVHSFSQCKKIVAQGSFDRLSHGEEEPKGHVRITIGDATGVEIKFVENEGAKKFVTVNCLGLSLEDTLRKVVDKANTLPDGSYIRVEVNHDNPILSNMELLIRQHPFMVFSKLVRDDEESAKDIPLVDEEQLFVPITITRDNIVSLLMDRVANSGANEEALNYSRTLLEKVVSNA